MKFQNPILNLKKVFDISRFLLQNLQKAITKKKMFFFYYYFHQVICSLSSIGCASVMLLAVTVFEISSFLSQNLQRAITQKIK